MFERRIFEDLVYLPVVIEPVSPVPEFLPVTRHRTPLVRRKTAIRAVLISAVIVVGQILLEALGIKLPSFSIAGGLVLLGISLQRVLSAADIQVAGVMPVRARRGGESPVVGGGRRRTRGDAGA